MSDHDREESTTPKKLAFQVRPNEPMIVITETEDGRKYETAIRVAILDVTDTGRPLPNDPSIPQFEFKAQMVAETKIIRK